MAAWALLIVACSCQKQSACCPPPKPPARPLNELSREQLRTFLKGYMGDWRTDTDQQQGIPPPLIQKPAPPNSTRVDLPAPDSLNLGNLSVKQAITQRRSLRNYAPTPFTLAELSYLLWCTQGIVNIEHDDDGNIVNHYRTVPSGGARHPFETYLIVNRVENLAPGLYRFLPLEHQLCKLRSDANVAAQLQQACYGQPFLGNAPLVFVWTAIPYRTEWRYDYIAHRMIAIEAGHVCQNLYLAAESIGGGACAVLGYSQDHLDRLLGVNGHTEFALYLAATGKAPVNE